MIGLERQHQRREEPHSGAEPAGREDRHADEARERSQQRGQPYRELRRSERSHEGLRQQEVGGLGDPLVEGRHDLAVALADGDEGAHLVVEQTSGAHGGESEDRGQPHDQRQRTDRRHRRRGRGRSRSVRLHGPGSSTLTRCCTLSDRSEDALERSALWTRLGWAALVCCLALGCQRGPEAVNVLLISIDSLRADHLHCYGHDAQTSPNIDRLASQSILFENAIADTTWTLPTHASLFTGLTSRVHRVTFDGHRIDPLRTTLAEALSSAGHRTRGFYSGPYLHPIFGFDQGFSKGDYEGVLGPIAYDDPEGFSDRDPREAARVRRELNQASHKTVTSPELTRKALAFLEEPRDRPFFLFLHYFDVHYDYVPPEEIWRRFDPDYTGNLTGVPFSNDRRIHRDMPERELQHLRALYDGEIFFTDHYVGRLLDTLEELGLADETLVVLTSDHGEEFFEHGQKGHRRNLYDETLKVPLIVRLPGSEGAGRRIQTQVAQIDVMPTILDLLELPIPEEIQGRSLEPLMRGGDPTPGEVLSRLVLPDSLSSVALRTDDWKLIVAEDEAVGASLHDLDTDPSEMHPLDAANHAERWAEARRRLDDAESDEERRLERLPVSEVEIELPAAMREALEELGYGE